MNVSPSDFKRHEVNKRKKWKQISRDTYGDILNKRKKRSRIRIVFQNINGLIVEDDENDKKELIQEFINKYKIDFFGIAEVNVNWRLVPKQDNLESMCKQWFEHSRVITAHNTLGQTKKRYQPGGVAIIATGELSLRVQHCTFDDRYMGRWCSMPIQGKIGQIIRLVSVYVPHVPTDSKTHGNKTVYEQQKAALLKLKSTKPVIEAFWTDFWRQIDTWLDQGEKLIISGDWNEDVYESTLRDPFKARELIPIITTKNKSPAPPTYNNGRYPIDEIFGSSCLDIKASGFLEHGLHNGDHRPIWIELDKNDALGTDPPPIMSFEARRLK